MFHIQNSECSHATAQHVRMIVKLILYFCEHVWSQGSHCWCYATFHVNSQIHSF